MAGRSQAEHNARLCDLLLSNGQFNDWVITSAFYSALHYVEAHLFPLTLGSETYIDFDTYYAKKIMGTINKHKARRELVALQLSSCSGAYNWLQDNCFNARYNSYVVKPEFAKKAKEKLAEIIAICDKP